MALRKGDATRARIIDAAARLAAARGLMAVSLGDVADAIGLSKSGLFKHFDSKEAMHEAVVEMVAERFVHRILDGSEIQPPGRPRLEGIFQRWLHWGETEWKETGCPIMALSVELDDQPGPLKDLLQGRLREFRRRVVKEFQALRDPPLSEAEAQAAYFQMKSFLLGQSDARRMMGDSDAHRAAEAAFAALLDRTARQAA
ncbi:MAG TPA: TetR/AcrR family transcriptional regulator [Phenylobacterium sp.]|nr:TetR/AcrR family transcriptional regulator [Phenylobacterium sp.]